MELKADKKGSAKAAYILGIAGAVLTIVMAFAIIYYGEFVRHEITGVGYLGAFLISIFGGATIIAPIPMTTVVFALGTVMKPAFAPYLGPVFVGAAAGLGETLGGVAIYMTGYGGGTAIFSKQYGKLQAIYERVMGWMERRGSLILFLLSAVLNPFFYPAALAAGSMRFGIKRFFLICWGGKTIKGMSVAAAGYWGLGAILRALGVPI